MANRKERREAARQAKRNLKANLQAAKGYPNAVKCAIVGLSKFAELLQMHIQAMPEEYKLLYFVSDTGEHIGAFGNGIEIIDIKQLAQVYDAGEVEMILVAEEFFYTTPKKYEQLKNNGITDKVFTVPQWFYHEKIPLDSALVQADMSKAVIDFMSPHTNLHCNYSCKSCCMASPIAEPEFISLQKYSDDMKRLGELFWHIPNIRITGGETLLHPDIIEIVKVTRETFPAAEIGVQSNGLLLLADDGQLSRLYDVMRENHCMFQISSYPAVYRQGDKLTEIMNRQGIPWRWGLLSGKEVEIFETFRTLLPTQNMDVQYNACYSAKACHALWKGYVYPCWSAISAEVIEKHFNVKFEGMAENIDKIRINLHDTTLDGWLIAEFCHSPTPMCKYCCYERMRADKWEQCPAQDAKLEDFILIEEPN